MSIGRSSTIGSGVPIGTHGTVLGIGVTIRDGGIHTLAGHMTGIGITAMRSTITTTGAPSVRAVLSTAVTMTCIAA